MVRLTGYEQEMLDGKYGKLKKKAMENIVQYANVLGAEELCEVTKAHVFAGAHSYLHAVESEDIEEVISEMQFCSKEKLSMEKVGCFCQTDCGPMDPIKYKSMGCTEAEGMKNKEYLDYYSKFGINKVGTCVPYLTGFIPLMGEHYVTSESHAVLMMNSLFGACGNADGLEVGYWSAICSRIPKWGNHIMENRKGTHLFNVDCEIKTKTDWDLLGYTIGRFLPTHSIPVVQGDLKSIDIMYLKYFYASMATTSGPEMCHIVGHTPEARTLEEAFGGKEPLVTKAITKADIDCSRKLLNDQSEGKIDYISIGCPHLSIGEMQQVASFMNGKKVADDVVFHVWTASSIKALADINGYTQIIEESGAIVLTSSCPLTSEKKPDKADRLAFDSGKQAHYIKPSTDAPVHYGDMEVCMQAAIDGEWRLI